MSDTYPQYTGSRGKTTGEQFVELLVRVFTIVIFILWVMPFLIAPAFGVTPEVYEQNEVLWSVFAAVIGYLVAYPVTKLVTKSIRSGGIK